METTKIDIYKRANRFEHDGETLLNAAKKGVMFQSLEEMQEIGEPHAILVKLGVRAEMTRQQIIICLGERMDSKDFLAKQLIQEEFEKRHFQEVTSLPGADKKLKKIIRNRLEKLMSISIQFCVVIVYDESELLEPPKKFEPKKPFSILSFLRDMLK